MTSSVHLEIIYQGDHCLACFYMRQAVDEVLPKYGRRVSLTLVEYTKDKKHARRFFDLSVSLYGEADAKRMRCAPIPSLFIEGELIFDMIPPREELIEAIDTALRKHAVSEH